MFFKKREKLQNFIQELKTHNDRRSSPTNGVVNPKVVVGGPSSTTTRSHNHSHSIDSSRRRLSTTPQQASSSPSPSPNTITPSMIRTLRAQILLRYTLDATLWNSGRHAKPYARAIHEKKMAQSEAVLADIHKNLQNWDDRSYFPDEQSWESFVEIKKRLGEEGKRDWGRSPPWEEGERERGMEGLDEYARRGIGGRGGVGGGMRNGGGNGRQGNGIGGWSVVDA